VALKLADSRKIPPSRASLRGMEFSREKWNVYALGESGGAREEWFEL
jgi:hypothetical protein